MNPQSSGTSGRHVQRVAVEEDWFTEGSFPGIYYSRKGSMELILEAEELLKMKALGSDKPEVEPLSSAY